MSLYSHKSQEAGAVQPWSQIITLAEAGKGCDGLFSLYDSLGDKTLVGANIVSTLLDGPEKVVRYGALTLGDGVTATSLTASNRCKGLTILCDSLVVKANATLHMTGRGARVLTNDDPFFPFIDFKIPARISLASTRMSLAQALATIKASGLAPWDQGTFQHLIAGLYGFDLSISLAGTTALLTAAGCGSGASGPGSGSVSHAFGNPGGAGTSGGMGGGGSGAAGSNGSNGMQSRSGRPGCPYGGGAGSGGACGSGNYYMSLWASGRDNEGSFSGPGGVGNQFDGPWTCGGGAGCPGGAGSPGYPGGDGVGGKLVIICRGAITVQSGGKIEANGMPGNNSAYEGGGSSGGGHVSLISPSAPSNSGTIQAAGGSPTAWSQRGGVGGAGSVVTKTFPEMGW